MIPLLISTGVVGISTLLVYRCDLYTITIFAVPALILGILTLIYSDLNGNPNIKERVYIGSTYHSRLYPKKHSFNYPLFYVGIQVWPRVETKLVSWNKFNILSLYNSDYLDCKFTGQKLESSLSKLLSEAGITNYTTIELITTPKVFGYSFNPVSYYFIYNSDSIVAMIFEVANTFNEKHLYICNEANRIADTKYEFTWTTKRGFHVSPFNNRTGIYVFHVNKSESNVYISINFKGYKHEQDCDNSIDKLEPDYNKLHFVANYSGKRYRLGSFNYLYLLTGYPINAMLTVPRIMYQAAIITYKRKLKIYQRPTPYFGNSGGTTIIKRPITPFHQLCITVFKEHFGECGKSLVVTVEGMEIRTGQGNDTIHMQVNSPEFFVWYCLHKDNILWAFFLAYCKGTVSISKSSLLPFLNLHCPRSKAIKNRDSLAKNITSANIPLQSKTLSSSGTNINLGLWFLKAEWFIFRNIATFYDGSDTWNLATRCKKYLETQSMNSVNNDWDGLTELMDIYSNIEKEQIRATFLLRSLG